MRALLAILSVVLLAAPLQARPRPHNVLLFVADGLRPGMINPANAPTMATLAARGVRFTNTHSLFPTFTTANASAMATGHHLGDTGDFSNNIETGFPVPGAGARTVVFLENDAILGDVDAHFAGDYLNQDTILKAARAAGHSTASIGKIGPALIFDHTERTGQHTIILDDATGRAGGIPLSDEMTRLLTQAGLPVQTPTRGKNGEAGTYQVPGTTVPDTPQLDYFAAVSEKVVLPLFKARGKPFVIVFWSRDPDGTQHNQGDSLNRLLPGINGPTSLAAIRTADDTLARLLAALKAQGLVEDTDVIVASDHGFSTISKESATSWAARQTYKDVNPARLPPGFVAIDLAHGLGLPLFDPDAKGAKVEAGSRPLRANGYIGDDPAHPDIIAVGNGGSDLIYLPGHDKALAAKAVAVLAAQDYVSGLFVDERLGSIPGTLPLSAISLKGTAVTPLPTIVVNFRSFATGCADPGTCGVEVADTPLQEGQGMRGGFSRADTRSTLIAAGPDFRTRFVDAAPSSNADVGKTIARILDLRIADKGKMTGRVLTEAMPNGAMPVASVRLVRSAPDAAGRVTAVLTQSAAGTLYFDAAGYPGRTLGLPAGR